IVRATRPNALRSSLSSYFAYTQFFSLPAIPSLRCLGCTAMVIRSPGLGWYSGWASTVVAGAGGGGVCALVLEWIPSAIAERADSRIKPAPRVHAVLWSVIFIIRLPGSATAIGQWLHGHGGP